MKIRLFIVSAIALVLFAACKTNEANYRAAYAGAPVARA